MLEIIVQGSEKYDDVKNEFISIESQTLKLEHSLVSISKWESKWKKPFFSSEKTSEQMMDYIKCMSLEKIEDDKVIETLSPKYITQIQKYIEDPMTATWFNDKENQGKRSSEVVTSELIYYWMIALNIPVEFEYWHINRLMTLIHICSIKNAPSKKMSKKEIMSSNAQLNAMRKAKHHTHG